LVEGPVVERGVLTAPAQAWDGAVRRAEVIARLAAKGTVGLAAADVAAAELGVSRRQVYMCWSGGGVRVRAWCRICCRPAPAAAVVAAGSRMRSRQSCGTCCGRGI